MSMDLDYIKQELRRNPGKSIVVTVLALALLAMLGGALHGGAPRAATASTLGGNGGDPVLVGDPKLRAEMEERVRQSRLLWQVLREERGTSTAAAFAFDQAYYTRDPSRTGPVVTRVVDPRAKSDTESADEQRVTAALARVREAGQGLRLHSTVMASRPLAVINAQIVRVGEQINGFRVLAIQTRQVILEKDGITLTLELGK